MGRFADFIKKPLDRATPEDVRDFQLHLIEERKVGWSSFNQAVCGLRFLYSVSIPRPWPVAMIPFGKRPKKPPTVLSQEECENPENSTSERSSKRSGNVTYPVSRSPGRTFAWKTAPWQPLPSKHLAVDAIQAVEVESER